MKGFCMRCGRPLGDGERYCMNCGMPVVAGEPAEEKTKARRVESVWLVLALVGLLLAFFSVAGAVLCLVAGIGASAAYRKTERSERKKKTRLIAAMLSGYLAAITGLLFYILLWIV